MTVIYKMEAIKSSVVRGCVFTTEGATRRIREEKKSRHYSLLWRSIDLSSAAAAACLFQPRNQLLRTFLTGKLEKLQQSIAFFCLALGLFLLTSFSYRRVEVILFITEQKEHVERFITGSGSEKNATFTCCYMSINAQNQYSSIRPFWLQWDGKSHMERLKCTL